jgi:hypothetical protein
MPTGIEVEVGVIEMLVNAACACVLSGIAAHAIATIIKRKNSEQRRN